MSGKVAHWFRDAIIYHVMIDRFAGVDPRRAADWDLPEFIGGNLSAIKSKLDYLTELGVNTLWLSPFCKTDGYHGYHVTDFKEIEPRFGSSDDLRSLAEECHGRNMRVIADLVPNHCHDSHEYFRSAREDPKSAYRDWFIFDEFNRHQSYMGIGFLPKLNLENPAARRHIIESAKHWQQHGIDGFRIDHVIGVSPGFLQELSQALSTANSENVIFGEALFGVGDLRKHYRVMHIKHSLWRRLVGFTQETLQKDYVGVLDGVLDFVFVELMAAYVAGRCHRDELEERLHRHFSRYPAGFSLVLFLSNHDRDRMFCQCVHHKRGSGRLETLKEVNDIMFKCARQYGHPVIIYYGDEILLNQVVPMPGGHDHADLLARRAMAWPSAESRPEFFGWLATRLKSLRAT